MNTSLSKKKLDNNIKIWIVEVGEPLPMPGTHPRLMRASQLAEQLVKDGINVVWWVSDFNHAKKCFYKLNNLPQIKGLRRLANGILAKFLHGRYYKNNVSFRRMLHNKDIAKNFRKVSTNMSPPDLIFCSYPTIDLAVAVTDYATRLNIPVILDIRDLWPDVFSSILPIPSWLVRILILPMNKRAKIALSRATALSAISEPILDWGLKKAVRKRNILDNVFHLSYKKLSLSPEEKKTTDNQWKSRGLKLDGTELIACCFTTLSFVPEFETVIESLNYLPRELLNKIRIVICGTGPRLNWMQEKTKTHPQLIVPGQVSAHEISSIMTHSFAGLLPYPNRSDFAWSFPNKIGEYFSSGLPIVSTLGGECGQLLLSRKCGIVVNNLDAKGFAQALVQLSKCDARWKNMSNCAQQVFNDMFDAEKNYKKMSAHINQIASSNQFSKK
jgi:glycosyltransferase involved in cell wall biosynthesis